jgi:hypothetical protein
MQLGFLTQSTLFAEDLILRQESAGVYNEYDEFVAGQTTDYNVNGSVMPVGGETRTNDVTGERVHDNIKICFDRQHLLSSLNQGTNAKHGDIIIYNNTNYRISSVQDYVNHGFINVTAIKLDGGV